MEILILLSLLVAAYLFGAFPTGTLIARGFGVNLTKSGSGSTGATNVARTVGKSAGIITLIIDIAKGVIPTLVAQALFGSLVFSASVGLIAVMGHCFSIPTVLKGGKGVASAIGVIFAIAPAIGLLAVFIFGISFYFSKIVSVSSILAALATAVTAIILVPKQPAYCALAAICLLVIWRHKPNLERLSRGEEPQFSARK